MLRWCVVEVLTLGEGVLEVWCKCDVSDGNPIQRGEHQQDLIVLTTVMTIHKRLYSFFISSLTNHNSLDRTRTCGSCQQG